MISDFHHSVNEICILLGLYGPFEDHTVFAFLPCSNGSFILQCHFSSEPLVALFTLLFIPVGPGSSSSSFLFLLLIPVALYCNKPLARTPPLTKLPSLHYALVSSSPCVLPGQCAYPLNSFFISTVSFSSALFFHLFPFSYSLPFLHLFTAPCPRSGFTLQHHFHQSNLASPPASTRCPTGLGQLLLPLCLSFPSLSKSYFHCLISLTLHPVAPIPPWMKWHFFPWHLFTPVP